MYNHVQKFKKTRLIVTVVTDVEMDYGSTPEPQQSTVQPAAFITNHSWTTTTNVTKYFTVTLLLLTQSN